MKFNTEITTRNWNNGWVDVNNRMPKDDTFCYILYSVSQTSYDSKTLKSSFIQSSKGMGLGTYKDKRWCGLCSNSVEEQLDNFWWLFYEPLNNADIIIPLKQTSDVNYTTLELDYFETNPNIVKFMYKEKRYRTKETISRIEIEILSWCSVPDEPENPFENEMDFISQLVTAIDKEDNKNE